MPPTTWSSSFSFLLLLRRNFSSSQTSGVSPLTAKTALTLLKSEKDPNRIFSICSSLLYSSPPYSHLHRSALCLAAPSLPSSSLRSLVLSSPLPPHDAILLFGRANMIDDALSSFTRSPSTRSLNALLFSCVLSHNNQRVPSLFRELPTRHRITPDLLTYNTVLKSYSLSGSSSSAYSLFDEMSSRKIKPNITSFTLALSGFYRERRLDDVDRILLLMKKHGLRPGHLSVYNARMQGLCKLGMLDEAKELLKEMRRKGALPNCVTYGHLILGFCSAGGLAEAMRLYREMMRRGLAAESECYFTLIHYLCRGREFGSALEICRESMRRNWVPRASTMRGLVVGLVSVEKTNEARELVAELKVKFPDHAKMWKEVEQCLTLQ